ncbi:hypothetical protein BKA61DRAFT_740191 [Leptodontidium sp. MPI-SDFR-AT-0119]|nr:hypothetical protein BKA61DRAFT_740191 [Leptodontidium sp. MPI-SDFR-AT-0119]
MVNADGSTPGRYWTSVNGAYFERKYQSNPSSVSEPFWAPPRFDFYEYGCDSSTGANYEPRMRSRNQNPFNLNTPQTQRWASSVEFSSTIRANPPVGDLEAGGELLEGQAGGIYNAPAPNQYPANPNTAQGLSGSYGEHYPPYMLGNAAAGDYSNLMGGIFQGGQAAYRSYEAQVQDQALSNGFPSTYSQGPSQTPMGLSLGGYHNLSLDNQHSIIGRDSSLNSSQVLRSPHIANLVLRSRAVLQA